MASREGTGATPLLDICRRGYDHIAIEEYEDHSSKEAKQRGLYSC